MYPNISEDSAAIMIRVDQLPWWRR